MSTITYLIVGDHDNCNIGPVGAYVHHRLYYGKEYAIKKAIKAVDTHVLNNTEVLEMNTSDGKITTVWKQDS